MSAVVSFIIPGRLSGKGRPRFVRATGHAFTPPKTRATEAMIREFAAKAMGGSAPMEGAVKLSISIRVNHTRSWSKAKRRAAVYVTGKPDADNIVKMIGDAANGILWRDDSQIAVIELDRRYDEGPEFTRVSVSDLSIAPFVSRCALSGAAA